MSSYIIGIIENSRCYPFYSKGSRYYIQLQFLLFLFYLKRLILDKVSLDFYIYQLFNNHTERLLDTVVPLNYLMSKDTSLILGVGELVSFTFFYNQCDF